MKKLFAIIFVTLAVLFMNVTYTGTAEASRVAVVPIQVNDELVERAGDFNGYYWDIMVDKFKYPEYELLDDEKVADDLARFTDGKIQIDLSSFRFERIDMAVANESKRNKKRK